MKFKEILREIRGEFNPKENSRKIKGISRNKRVRVFSENEFLDLPGYLIGEMDFEIQLVVRLKPFEDGI